MFKEYQIRPEGNIQRRWFKSQKVDLVVWLEAETILHFQIGYDALVFGLLQPRVIKYSHKSGLRSFTVPGDESMIAMSKILQPNSTEESKEWVRKNIECDTECIPKFIRDFILEKLPREENPSA